MKQPYANSLFYSFLIVYISVYFQSCKKESVIETYKNNYSFETDLFFVKQSSAFTIAENIDKFAIVKNTKGLKTTNSQKRIIKNQLTIRDIEGQIPYIYIFNYESGGYLIVSADQRLSPILGLCENGEFILDSIPQGMAHWLECIAAQEKNIRASNNLPSEVIRNEWDNFQDISNSVKRAPIDDDPPEYYLTVGPFLSTKWGQGTGYNTYCPILTGGPDGHAKTGCGTTAVAQIMAYWKFPARYNWNDMSNYASDATACLIGDIFPWVIDIYDVDGSSCKNDWNMVHAFQNFGYRSCDLAGYVNGYTENGGYKHQTVVSNLDQGQPVILGAYSSYTNILGFISFPKGSGHIWVCDGYKKMSIIGSGYLLFHMNWGWYGAYNGWYTYNDWSSDGGSYNFFPDLVYNIRP